MTELTNLDLPPERELPEEIRLTARATILAGLHAEPRRHRAATLISVAAAFAVLAAAIGIATLDRGNGSGTTSAASQSDGPQNNSPVANPTVSPRITYHAQNGAPDDLASRCVARAAKIPGLPAPASWTAVFTASANDDTVIAYRTTPGVVFCDLTPSSVTLSPVVTRKGTAPVQPAFLASSGAFAGLVDPRYPQVAVLESHSVPGAETGGAADGGAVVQDGIFVLPNGVMPEPDFVDLMSTASTDPKAKGPVTQFIAKDLPPASPAFTDRTVPQGDRTSPAGQRLRTCLTDDPGRAIVDPDAWTPGGDYRTQDEGTSVQLAVYDNLILACELGADNEPIYLMVLNGMTPDPAELSTADNPYLTLTSYQSVMDNSAKDWMAVGLLKNPSAATVEFTEPNGATVHTPIDTGMFLIDKSAFDNQIPKTVSVFDGSGHLLMQQPVQVVRH